MKITPDIKATANGAVDAYSGLTPILKLMVARSRPEVLELAYHIQGGNTPHFTQADAQALNVFFDRLNELHAAYLRHFGHNVNSKCLMEMAGF